MKTPTEFQRRIIDAYLRLREEQDKADARIGVNYQRLFELTFPAEQYPKAHRTPIHGGPRNGTRSFLSALGKLNAVLLYGQAESRKQGERRVIMTVDKNRLWPDTTLTKEVSHGENA